MIRKLGVLAFAGALFASGAFAQLPGGGVQQQGAITPNDCVAWAANGKVKDAGSPCGGGGGSGTVTSVSVTTQNGVSASVTNPTTTPALAFTLGAINPGSVAIGAGSPITSSGPGGALTALGYTVPGTGVATALGVNIGSPGAFITFNGALGTPSAGVATNLTGLPISTGLTGAGTGVLTALGINVGSLGAVVTNGGALGTPSSGVLTNATGLAISTGLTGAGTGVLAALGVNIGSAGAPALFNGAVGTPSSITLTNGTGLPISTGVSGLGTGVATALGNTAGGAGGFALVGSTPPTGTAGGDLSGSYPDPTVSKVAGVTPGTGVATALGVNVGSAGSFVVNGGALGTPASGVGTNLTGTAAALTAGNVTAGWHTLARSNVEQTVVTGIASKTTSYSLVIPGGTLNANGSLRVSFLWTFVGAVGTKQVGIDWGGTTFWSTNAFVAGTLAVNGQASIANRNSASSQIARVSQNTSATFTGITAANVTGAINTAADQTLTLWVVMNGALDTGAVESVIVEYNND